MAVSQGKALLNEFSYGKLASVFTKTAKTRVIFFQSLCKITADNRSLPDKYKFGVKNSLSGINKAQSEASDDLPAFNKMQSETSDALPATNKMPSESSDTFTATNEMLSEASDALPATNKMPSEVSDVSTTINSILSETSDIISSLYKFPKTAFDGVLSRSGDAATINIGFGVDYAFDIITQK
ncbi:MAG: hypothetical protein HDR36_01485 [Treponema sp.]|nr:hypothetical protein [Treponema sp.]